MIVAAPLSGTVSPSNNPNNAGGARSLSIDSPNQLQETERSTRHLRARVPSAFNEPIAPSPSASELVPAGYLSLLAVQPLLLQQPRTTRASQVSTRRAPKNSWKRRPLHASSSACDCCRSRAYAPQVRGSRPLTYTSLPHTSLAPLLLSPSTREAHHRSQARVVVGDSFI